MLIRRAIPVLSVLALSFGVFATIHAQKADDSRKDVKRVTKGEAKTEEKKGAPQSEPVPSTPALKVYEWGVATMNWDGSDEGPDDVPTFYYDHTEVPIEPARQPAQNPDKDPIDNPAPNPEKPMRIRKPVLYFECDRDLTFDLDVKFTSGKLTWMYPKPNRLTDASTVQWDNIKLFDDRQPRDKFAPPELHEIDAAHWANYSREGSTSSLVVNGEHERFLFYEGDRFGLPDTDIFKNADGEIVVRNYTGHELIDLRVCLEVDGALKRWLVSNVPAASGDKPGAVTLGDDLLLEPGEFLAAGDLTSETHAAGLTDAQAKVFERCWQSEFSQPGCMSWRRTQKALDEMFELKLTLPAGLSSETHRVGYVLVNNIDLKRQAELDALVTKAVAGDADAEQQLKAGGTAGAGALRRAVAADDLPLKQRLKIAQMLGEVSGTR